MTSGQADGLAQLRAIEGIRPDAIEILDVGTPDPGDSLRVEVSIDCRGVEHETGGLKLRDRERLDIFIGPNFPFEPPSVYTAHRRWAGTPHVQWEKSLCLYLAPSVEWNPGYGMIGFVERLWLWLQTAAAGDLDPAGAPLHPPVAYTSGDTEVPTIIPRVDTPEVTNQPWIGGVELDRVGDSRIDLGAWHESSSSWFDGAAPAILLPSTLDFEYPRSINALLDALAERGVPRDKVLLIMKAAAITLEKDQPLILVVGTAMRGTETERRQHLAAWYIKPLYAWGLSRSLLTAADDPDTREMAEKLKVIVEDWAKGARIEWCPVREDRPEVTHRRDTGSPLEHFQGKTVAIWGCGALGAPLAEAVVRAGAGKVILRDKAAVSPGILVRQPFYDDDIGKAKSRVLASRLGHVRPSDCEVVFKVGDVLRTVLEEDDWHEGADIVIDATASSIVAAKLERTRRLHRAPATVVSMFIGHTAEHVLATITPAGYGGAGVDAARKVKLACGRDPSLRGFLDEFWPDPPRTEVFQPEPGCSDPTFTGSAAEVLALATRILIKIAVDLQIGGDAATAHLATIAKDHEGTRESQFTFRPSQITFDGAGSAEVRISPEARIKIVSEVARAAREVGPESETGGLLYGEYDSAIGVIWVDEASGPPPDSSLSPELFICGTEGVGEQRKQKSERGRGSLEYLGMWHTHPEQDPRPSSRDLAGILELLDASSSPISQGLLLIVGHTLTGPPVLGTFIYERSELEDPGRSTVSIAQPVLLEEPVRAEGEIGIALSGGGSRAIAFHLGCLRALNDRGLLDRARVISSVSGGSVINALWAYSDDDFGSFDERIRELLAVGLQMKIARRALLSKRAPQQLGTRLVAGTAATAAGLARLIKSGTRSQAKPPPLARWVSRTDAFIDVLERILGTDVRLGDRRRGDLDVVINACELSTGSAFRFGSRESGCWRTGKLLDGEVSLAEAVAASAAYPLALPALDRTWDFAQTDGSVTSDRIVLTDGGVYDNLGTSCLEPGRSRRHGFNHFDVDYVIACDAGQGLLDPKITYGWIPRIQRSFSASFRKLQDGGRGRLHSLTESGKLEGFAMPYLGQSDRSLPEAIPDLVTRAAVAKYPTDFRAMEPEMISKLSLRGEQLTSALLDAYLPSL